MKRWAYLLFVVACVLSIGGATLLFARPGAEASPDVTITVNSQGDGDSPFELTLRQAMRLATGDLSLGALTFWQCQQVSGASGGWPAPEPCHSDDPPGADSADTIVFDPSVFPPGAVNQIFLGSTLPTLDTGDDTVDGSSTWDGSKNWVIVRGQDSFRCFWITSDNNAIKGLVISGCGSAVSIGGVRRTTPSGAPLPPTET